MKNKWTYIVSLLIIPVSIYSQKQDTTLNKQVNVSADYNPVVNESQRIFIDPSNKIDSSYTNKTVDYDFSVSPINNKVEAGDLSLQAIKVEDRNLANNQSYAQAFVGSYGSFMGKLLFSMLQSSTDQLSLYIEHNSILGKVKLDNGFQSKLGLNNTLGKIKYEKLIGNLTASSSILYNYLGFRYYGLNNDGTSPNNEKAAHSNLQIDLGLKSNWLSSSFVSHETNLYGSIFSLQDELSENIIGLNGHYYYIIDNLHRIGVDLNFEQDFYSVNSKYNSVKYNFDNRFSAFLKPYYGWIHKDWTLKLGLGMFLSSGFENYTLVSPRVEGDVMISDQFKLYAIVDGDLKVNDYKKISTENKYIIPWLNVTPTKIPIQTTLGIKGNINEKSSLKIWGSYVRMDKQYLFSNNLTFPSNQFTVVYDNVSRIQFGGMLNYIYDEQLSFEFEAKYNDYTTNIEDKPWYLPMIEGSFAANYSLNHFWDFKAIYSFNGGRYSGYNAKGVINKLKNWNDISIAAEYSFMDNIKFYANLNNILSSNYYAWDGYKGLGINLMIGASIMF